MRKGQVKMLQTATAEKHGFDGQDMSLRPLTDNEIGPRKKYEPGYDEKLNHETRKRRYQSHFQKNIYERWDEKKDRHRLTAAETYLFHAERMGAAYSVNNYEDTPPPEHYGPKGHANEKRMESAKWLWRVNSALGVYWAGVLADAMVVQLTVPKIYAKRNILGKKSKSTAYREGWKMVNHAFDLLSEIGD